MIRRSHAAAVAALAFISLPMVMHAQTQPVCTFSVTDAVPIGPDPSTVLAKLSIPIGDSLSVSFPMDAHVEVFSASHGKTDGPRTATLVLSTLHATAGQWAVTIRGEKGTCNGKIWIGQGVKGKQNKR